MHRNAFYFLNKTYVMVIVGTLNKHLNEAALKLNTTNVHHTRDILVKTTWMSCLFCLCCCFSSAIFQPCGDDFLFSRVEGRG